jgi:hypothetical protein
MHDCVYCDQPGRFKIVNGNIPERGTIWVSSWLGRSAPRLRLAVS